MTKEPHFKFNRKLEPRELEFWQKFFDNFPCHHNRYFQSVVNECASTPNLVEKFYSSIAESISDREMIAISDKSSWNDVAKKSFKSIVEELRLILPNSTSPSLALLAIYGGLIQEWNLELTPKGINLLGTELPEVSKITYAPQLAMMADLMAGRIMEFDSTLNVNPIFFDNSFIINDNLKGMRYLIYVEKNGQNNLHSFINHEGNGISVTQFRGPQDSILSFDFGFDFAYDFSYNSGKGMGAGNMAPLDSNQESLLNLIRKNYLKNNLENSLPKKLDNYNKKNKI